MKQIEVLTTNKAKKKNFASGDFENEFYELLNFSYINKKLFPSSIWNKDLKGKKFLAIDLEHRTPKNEKKYLEFGCVAYSDYDEMAYIGYHKIAIDKLAQKHDKIEFNLLDRIAFCNLYRSIIIDADYLIFHKKSAELTYLSSLLNLKKEYLLKKTIDTMESVQDVFFYKTRQKNFYSLPSIYHNLLNYSVYINKHNNYCIFGSPFYNFESFEVEFSFERLIEMPRKFLSHNPLFDAIQTFLIFFYLKVIKENFDFKSKPLDIFERQGRYFSLVY